MLAHMGSILAQFTERVLVSASARLLNLSLTSDLVPEQDVIDVIIHVGRNPQGRNLAWKYFREKWDILNSR